MTGRVKKGAPETQQTNTAVLQIYQQGSYWSQEEEVGHRSLREVLTFVSHELSSFTLLKRNHFMPVSFTSGFILSFVGFILRPNPIPSNPV